MPTKLKRNVCPVGTLGAAPKGRLKVWRDRMRAIGTLVLAISLVPVCALAQAGRWDTGRWNTGRLDAGRPGELCQTAIAGNAPATRLPPNLLTAIGRVESGRLDPRDGNVKAWPWSINAEGRGYTFNTKAEAIAAVTAFRARNVMSVDVGCMQVNLMYHPAAFASLEEAFDPAANVRYAAKFLGQLFAETGDWNTAAAHYHSKTPDLALAYQRKVLAQLPGAARVQAVSAEQLSLTSAWASTLGTAPASAPRQMTGTLEARNWGAAPRPAHPRTILLASRR